MPMPQMSRGGKFVFGESIIRSDGMELFEPEPGMRLLSVRSSNIAFTMGARGVLLDKAEHFGGVIPLF